MSGPDAVIVVKIYGFCRDKRFQPLSVVPRIAGDFGKLG